MKHWFVEWLNKKADEKRLLAEEGSLTNQIDAERYQHWATVAEDMIHCGLESAAFQYYDVKQSMEPCRLPHRPQNSHEAALQTIVEETKTIAKSTNDLEKAKKLNNISTVLEQLMSIGMYEDATRYYKKIILHIT